MQEGCLIAVEQVWSVRMEPELVVAPVLELALIRLPEKTNYSTWMQLERAVANLTAGPDWIELCDLSTVRVKLMPFAGYFRHKQKQVQTARQNILDACQFSSKRYFCNCFETLNL